MAAAGGVVPGGRQRADPPPGAPVRRGRQPRDRRGRAASPRHHNVGHWVSWLPTTKSGASPFPGRSFVRHTRRVGSLPLEPSLLEGDPPPLAQPLRASRSDARQHVTLPRTYTDCNASRPAAEAALPRALDPHVNAPIQRTASPAAQPPVAPSPTTPPGGRCARAPATRSRDPVADVVRQLLARPRRKTVEPSDGVIVSDRPRPARQDRNAPRREAPLLLFRRPESPPTRRVVRCLVVG